jgi:hypothetical protein
MIGSVTELMAPQLTRTRSAVRWPRRLRPARSPEHGARGLGVGVVSRNTVDAAIEVAHERRVPVMLVASRRQVDSEEFGGGYVEGWCTEAFARYVRSRDPWNVVRLCRDHGGPWQHPSEVQAGLSEREALRSALASFETDILSGFEVLHVDTSVTCDGSAESRTLLDRLLFLYARASDIARERGLPIEFEIGYEEQGPEIPSRARLEASTCASLDALEEQGLPRPRYVVVQTGTKVVERRNIGELCAADRGKAADRRLRTVVDVCHGRSVAVKAHNCDYLHAAAWDMLADAGVDAANVAPEYGVVETSALLDILGRKGMRDDRDRFLQLAYDSGKWRKWMAAADSASDYERAVIAGHYVFSTPEFAVIRERLARRYGNGAKGLDRELRDPIKRQIANRCERLGMP